MHTALAEDLSQTWPELSGGIVGSAENFLQTKPLDSQAKRQKLEQLLNRADIWQAANEPRRQCSAIASGYPGLDALLTGHGWPRGATTELLLNQTGIGEFTLLLPALAELTQHQQTVILINPPHIPYAPALANSGIRLENLLILHPRGPKDRLWAIEQSLQSGSCGALLSWQDRQIPNHKDLRRLQVAARTGDCLHFHFRPQSESTNPSPASLRLKLESAGEQLALNLLKQLGGPSGQHLYLARTARLVHRDQPLH
ncbi:translesion DNA synthesis-associated protein ImuA [Microbulbifer sp. OS29]|uniref:Translesion DNA synthesis-associated protein ImuA n=1 Tax=Microbulbifer okhotskensis TaxID=2926617 RepID=A0A9X2ELE8_9GAMM|nr:translesion DNA synthesis-associated protein ImuA [Microbulbifer okhotskensis]MCO1334399.1 translesion DNA synthesis-associated protein ImuA [Microbulbifer okhotskensis]